MIVEQTVTYLRMLTRQQLRPARPVAGLELAPVEDPTGADATVIRDLHDRIATPHHWSSLSWSTDRWHEWLATPGQRHWCVVLRGERIGWCCLQVHSATDLEIDNFGLVPDRVGRGYGGAALTQLTRIAWDLIDEKEPLDREGTSSSLIWLHTSSFDHPHALRNYEARGFEVYASETHQRRVATLPTPPSTPPC